MKIKGTIYKIIYQNDNGYTIALLKDFDKPNKFTTVLGNIGLMDINVIYELEGEFVEDKVRKSLNFQVQSFQKLQEFSNDNLIKYLSSSLFPTIGSKLAKKIVEDLGSDAINKIKNNPDCLNEVEGMSSDKKEIITSTIKKYFKDDKLFDVFNKNNLKMEFLNYLQKNIEDEHEIESILSKDFYFFAEKNGLGPFQEVDRTMLAFGLEPESEVRISWWAKYIVNEILFKTGDTFTVIETLRGQIAKVFGNELINDLSNKLIYAKENKILIFKNKKIYTKESWDEEEIISSKLIDMKNRSIYIEPENDFEKIFLQVEEFVQNKLNIPTFHYNDEQKNALKKFIDEDILIITGGPGTGKTTVILGLVKMFELYYKKNNYALVAPTGRAAARIKETSGYATSTIHRLLKYSGNDSFEYDDKNPLYKDLLIVDESSMIDNRLFSSMLKGVTGMKKVVLVGDVDQLPSVSYGNVFQDLIDSEKFEVARLIKNNRQSSNGKDNGIIALANAIKNNDVENFNFENNDDLEFIFNNDTNKTMKDLIEVYSGNKPSDIEDELFDVQIIAPMYKENLGITNVNNKIQEIFNSENEKTIYKKAYSEFRIKDKVMFSENDMKLELSNGDVGYIKELKFNGKKLDYATVRFGYRDLTMYAKNFDSINLSYACSIHKTQGSEYKNVILVLDNSNRMSNFFLDKKMLYTAITRAKNKLFVIGDKDLFIKSSQKESKKRQTTLKEKIIEKSNII